MNTGPFKMNPGFNRLPQGVQDKILKKSPPTTKIFPTGYETKVPSLGPKKMPVDIHGEKGKGKPKKEAKKNKGMTTTYFDETGRSAIQGAAAAGAIAKK